MRFTGRLTCIIITFALVGCGVENSCEIVTQSFQAVFLVTESSEQTANASATFSTGAGLASVTVELDCGDTISVNSGILARKPVLGFGASYESEITKAATYDFVFARPGEDPYSSTVQAPAAIEITAPSSAAELSRGDRLTVAWTTSPADWMHIEVTADKMTPITAQVPDNGSYTLPAGAVYQALADWRARHGGVQEGESVAQAEGEFPLSIRLYHDNTGQMAAGLSGSITARCEDRLTVLSVE